MKKGYFIAYLGAVASMCIAFTATGKMIKKYGQPLKAKKKISPEKLAKIAEKGMDFFAKKKATDKTVLSRKIETALSVALLFTHRCY